MAEGNAARWATWGLNEVLSEFPGLRIRLQNNCVLLAGELDFRAEYTGYGVIEDSYRVTITIPMTFPRQLPTVRVTDSRIPRTFHTNPDKSLCLGSPLRLHSVIRRKPQLIAFIKECVIPYLFTHSCWEKNHIMPFGELSHGNVGLIEDYMVILGITDHRHCVPLIGLAGEKKRLANRRSCPCGSGLRLGRCHHQGVNRLRRTAHRSWLRKEYKNLFLASYKTASIAIGADAPAHAKVAVP